MLPFQPKREEALGTTSRFSLISPRILLPKLGFCSMRIYVSPKHQGFGRVLRFPPVVTWPEKFEIGIELSNLNKGRSFGEPISYKCALCSVVL